MIDQPGYDATLARALHQRGDVPLPKLLERLAEPGTGATLAPGQAAPGPRAGWHPGARIGDC